MAGWWVRQLGEIPRIGPEEPRDPEWYPIQHHFGLTAFGVNVYVARAAGDLLSEEHDETHSGHEEVYFVVSGRARFTLDGEPHDAGPATLVAVPDPRVRRSVEALDSGTTLLAIGGPPREQFESSWNARHFEGVPRAE
jgi:Cupin domain